MLINLICKQILQGMSLLALYDQRYYTVTMLSLMRQVRESYHVLPFGKIGHK